MEEAADRERLAARGGRPPPGEVLDKFVPMPIGEGSEDLTIEMAMELADRAEGRMAAFKAACGAVMGEDPER